MCLFSNHDVNMLLFDYKSNTSLLLRIWKPQKRIKNIKITHNPLLPLTFSFPCSFLPPSPTSFSLLTDSGLVTLFVPSQSGEEDTAGHIGPHVDVLCSGVSPRGLWKAGLTGTRGGCSLIPARGCEASFLGPFFLAYYYSY